MAEPKRHKVELSEFLADQPLVAIKGLASAPIAYRVERMIDVFRTEARIYGIVGHAELVSALLHATSPDRATLATMIENYREARVWETRRGLGEATPQTGTWEVVLRGQGQRVAGSTD
jgi:hypothetical protein